MKVFFENCDMAELDGTYKVERERVTDNQVLGFPYDQSKNTYIKAYIKDKKFKDFGLDCYERSLLDRLNSCDIVGIEEDNGNLIYVLWGDDYEMTNSLQKNKYDEKTGYIEIYIGGNDGKKE